MAFVTIERNKQVSKNNEDLIKFVSKFLRRCKINFESFLKYGDPEQEIISFAADNHIIIMGASGRSPLTKFFRGSIPLNVMDRCKCPILIVK